MDYVEVRAKALEKLGHDGVRRLAETAGVRFKGSARGDEITCNVDDDDDNPSGSFNLSLGVLCDHRDDQSSKSIEGLLGNGDKSLGARLLLQEAGLAIVGNKRGKSPDLGEFRIEELRGKATVTEIQSAVQLLNSFFSDCTAHLLSLPLSHRMIDYLTRVRGITPQVSAARQMGIIPEHRLHQLLNDLQLMESPLAAPIDRFVNAIAFYANRLVWPMQDRQCITHFKTRGLPRPGKTNPKNMHTCTLVEGGSGWFGIPGEGPLTVVEGEFNLLQTDNAVGSLINGIAVGSSSIGMKSARDIHALSKTITVIGDDDAAGRKMVQAIADLGLIQVIYPPNGLDADEYLKRNSWESLMTLAKTLRPSWDGYRVALRSQLLKDANENLKDQVTTQVIAAVTAKGRMVRSGGELLFIEE